MSDILHKTEYIVICMCYFVVLTFIISITSKK